MQTRNAASVLPEPVGAAISVSRPSAIAPQPPAWGGVGPSGNRLPNQVRTAGWNCSICSVTTVSSYIRSRIDIAGSGRYIGPYVPSRAGPTGRARGEAHGQGTQGAGRV